jgi:hypothetical protein
MMEQSGGSSSDIWLELRHVALGVAICRALPRELVNVAGRHPWGTEILGP